MNESNRNRANEPFGKRSTEPVRACGLGIAGVALLVTLAACQGTTQIARAPVGGVQADKSKTETPAVRLSPTTGPDQETANVEAPVDPQGTRCEVPNFDGGRSYVVRATTLPPKTKLNVGQLLKLQIDVSTPAYLTIFHVSTSCKVARLLDNYPVQAYEIFEFPDPDTDLELEVKPPIGKEAFHFVATREPLAFLASNEVYEGDYGIAGIDLVPKQFHERLEDARRQINPDAWASTTMHTSIVRH